jgi:hypothetical protein
MDVEHVEVEVQGARAHEIVAFVRAHPAATAYAMPAWLLAVRRSVGGDVAYEVARLDGRIAGVLPVATSPLHALVALLPPLLRPVRRASLGWSLQGGPLLAPGLAVADAARVLAALAQSLLRPPALLATICLPSDLDASFYRAVAGHGFRRTTGHRVAVKPLAGLTQATLAGTYGEEHRAAVVAASRHGVVVARATGPGDLLELWDMLDESTAGTGSATRPAQAFVVDGGRELLSAGVGDLWMGSLDGVPVAGAFVLHAARTTCLWLGATSRDVKAQRHRPMNAVLHHAMADAVARGHERFELGGLAGVDGLRTPKADWGAREYEQLTYEWSYGDLAKPLRAAR